MTLALRASAPPVVGSALVTPRLSSVLPWIFLIVPASVLPAAPAVTATTATVAEPTGPISVTDFCVAYFFEASDVSTIHPFGTVSEHKKQLKENVTLPVALAASICFVPVGVPGNVCDWLA